MLSAIYYDGETTRRTPVTLAVTPDGIRIAGLPEDKSVPWREIRWPEPRRHGPRLLRFADDSFCEIADGAAFDRWRAQHRLQAGFGAATLIQRWHTVMACVAVLIAMLFASYRWGLPAFSEWMAFRLPADTLLTTEQETLKFLDAHLMQPSQLPPERQQALRDALAQMRLPPGTQVDYRLEFRASSRMGANAFALPAGIIVVTDDLVNLAQNDAQVLGVLAHEIGHQYHRHALRSVIQTTVVGAVTAWFFGDVSSILAGVPALLLDLRYSRGFELEADTFAVRMLKANGQTPAVLADMLLRLEEAAEDKQRKEDKPGEKDAAQDEHRRSENSLFDYFSTHPDTEERIARLRTE